MSQVRMPIYERRVQANAATVNAGSAGVYAQQPGLEHMGKALSGGLGAIAEIEVRKQREVRELEAMADIQEYQGSVWKYNDTYMEERKGRNAVNAEADAQAEYDKFLQPLIEKHAGDRRTQDFIRLKARGIALSGLNTMRDYGNKQQDVFRESESQVQQGIAERVWLDPNSTPIEREQAYEDAARMSAYNNTRAGLSPERAQLQNEALYNGLLFKRSMVDAKTEPYKALSMLDGKPVPVNLPPESAELAQRMAEKVGVPPDYLKAIMYTESRGNPNAVSPVGARGLMQVMPETQTYLEKKYNIDMSTPEGNAEGGALYAKEMLDRYNGDQRLAAMAYNWGPGNVDSLLKNGHGLKTKSNPNGVIPAETKNYVSRILGDGEGGAASRLDMMQQLQIRTAAESTIKAAEAEARQKGAVLRQNQRGYFAYGMDTGDFSQVDTMVQSLQAAGLNKEAGEAQFQKDMYVAARSAMEGSRNEPPAQQMDEVTAFFNKAQAQAPESAVLIQNVRDDTLKFLEQRGKQFFTDPAGYVASSQEGPYPTEEARIEDSLARQRYMAEGQPGFTPRVIPLETGKIIKGEYATQPDAQKKAEMLMSLQQQFGKYAPQAFAEAGLPNAAVAVSQVLPSVDTGTATRLVVASSTALKDIPGLDAAGKDVAKDAADASPLAQTLTGISTALWNSQEQSQYAQDMLSTLESYSALGWDIKDLESKFSIINDSGMAIVAPAGLDVDAVSFALETKRRELVAGTGAISLPTTGNAGADARLQALIQFSLTATYQSGIWAYDGEGFAMVDPVRGRFAIDGTGKPIRVSIDDTRNVKPPRTALPFAKKPNFKMPYEKS